MKIAWIGAGKMGLPLCKRLKAAGHDVSALVRRPEQDQKLSALGFTTCNTLAKLVHGADVVFTCVSDDQALADVMLSREFNAALAVQAICVDMSTVSTDISAQVATNLPDTVRYLRSPVSGSTAMADAGTLTALVSGPKSAFDQMAPLYESFAKKAFYLGPAEEARYLKLAINSMVAATSALLGEALAVGNQAGMSDAAMLEVITQSAVASPLIGYKKDMIVSGDYRPAATLTMLSKDLGLFLKAAAGTHVATPINTEVHRLFEEASSRGLGEKDFFVLVQEAKKGRQV